MCYPTRCLRLFSDQVFFDNDPSSASSLLTTPQDSSYTLIWRFFFRTISPTNIFFAITKTTPTNDFHDDDDDTNPLVWMKRHQNRKNLTPFEPLARPLLSIRLPHWAPRTHIPRDCRPNWQEELTAASQGWDQGSAGGFIFFCYQVFAWLLSFFCIQSSYTMNPQDMTTTIPKKLSATNPWRKLSLPRFSLFAFFLVWISPIPRWSDFESWPYLCSEESLKPLCVCDNHLPLGGVEHDEDPLVMKSFADDKKNWRVLCFRWLWYWLKN